MKFQPSLTPIKPEPQAKSRLGFIHATVTNFGPLSFVSVHKLAGLDEGWGSQAGKPTIRLPKDSQ